MATMRAPALRSVLPKPSPRPSTRGCLGRTTTPLVPARYKSGPYGYTQAKSLVFTMFGEPSDVLKLHTHSLSPTLPAGSVLLRALAAPINPADVNTIQGTYGVKPSFSPLIGTQEPAVIPGNEGVFEVVAPAGPLTKGDWVIPAKTGFGTWRTHAVAPVDSLIRVDKEGLQPAQVGTVSVNPCSAYRMLRDYAQPALREGDWFVQNGANSGVGRAAIQLGRLWGYHSINVVRARETEAETRALKDELTALGATHVVTEDEFQTREFRDSVERWTGVRPGRAGGLRLGLNCVGGGSAQAMTKVLGAGGTMVTYGGMSRKPFVLPTGLLIFNDVRFLGFWLSRWADAHPDAKAHTIREILDLVRAGKLRDTPTVDVPWTWETEESTLRDAVQGTLTGFRKGKGVFVFGET